MLAQRYRYLSNDFMQNNICLEVCTCIATNVINLFLFTYVDLLCDEVLLPQNFGMRGSDIRDPHGPQKWILFFIPLGSSPQSTLKHVNNKNKDIFSR